METIAPLLSSFVATASLRIFHCTCPAAAVYVYVAADALAAVVAAVAAVVVAVAAVATVVVAAVVVAAAVSAVDAACHFFTPRAARFLKGLMFSAGKDLSIVIWYPPRESSARLPRQRPHLPTTPLLEKDQESRGHSRNLDSPQSRSPARAPPSLTSTSDESVVDVSFAGTENDFQTGRVTHKNEPGVVLHVAEVVGMAVIPSGLVSADLAGRLIVQGPDRLTGKLCLWGPS